RPLWSPAGGHKARPYVASEMGFARTGCCKAAEPSAPSSQVELTERSLNVDENTGLSILTDSMPDGSEPAMRL
ncbi:MAG: hypothetical protein ACRD2O_13995, partial [Terriglobia bacterium]